MRVAVTGAAGRLGRAMIGRSRRRRSRGRWGRSPGPGPRSTSTRSPRTRVARPARARSARGRRPHGGLDRRRRLRPRSRARDAPQRRCDRASLARACAARGVELVLVSTNEVFDGRRTDGGGLRPRSTRRTRSTRTARASRGRASRPKRRTSRTTAASPASRSSGRAGSTARPATTSRRRSRPPRCGREPPVSRSGSSVTRSAARRTPGPRRGDRRSCSPRTPWPGAGARRSPSTTSSTAAVRPAPTGRARSCASPASTSRSRRSRRRPGSAHRTPPPWAVLEPTPLPSGEPMRHWRRGVRRRGPRADPVPPEDLTRASGRPADVRVRSAQAWIPGATGTTAFRQRTDPDRTHPHRTPAVTAPKGHRRPDDPSIGPAGARRRGW